MLIGILTASAGTAATASRALGRFPGHETALSNVTFVAFDTETTGFDADGCRIVEIGAVKFRNGVVIDEREWLVNPGQRIPYWAQRVHGITSAMVKNSPSFKDVYSEFSAFIEDSVLMAHNATFDISFIAAEVERNGLAAPENPVLDSLTLFRRWYPEAESHSLEPLTAHLGIEQGVFHRATADSRYILSIMNIWLGRQTNALRYGRVVRDAGGEKHF